MLVNRRIKKQPNISGPLTKRYRYASGCSVHGGGGAMLCYQEPGPGGLVPVCLGLAQTQPPDPSIYIIARHGGRPGRGRIVDNIFHLTRRVYK